MNRKSIRLFIFSFKLNNIVVQGWMSTMRYIIGTVFVDVKDMPPGRKSMHLLARTWTIARTSSMAIKALPGSPTACAQHSSPTHHRYPMLFTQYLSASWALLAPSVPYRIRFRFMLLTLEALHGLAPVCLVELLTGSPHNLPDLSAGQDLLEVPSHILKSCGGRSFACVAPSRWNDVPDDLRSTTSLSVFKTGLKAYLFRDVNGPVVMI